MQVVRTPANFEDKHAIRVMLIIRILTRTRSPGFWKIKRMAGGCFWLCGAAGVFLLSASTKTCEYNKNYTIQSRYAPLITVEGAQI